MKIRRFSFPSCHNAQGKSVGLTAYAYLKCNFIECYYLDKLIAAGKSNLRRHPNPREYRADYIITTKRS
jgi:hypothetical protein